MQLHEKHRPKKLDGAELVDYRALAVDCDSNLREMLQRVEAGEMATKTTGPKRTAKTHKASRPSTRS